MSSFMNNETQGTQYINFNNTEVARIRKESSKFKKLTIITKYNNANNYEKGHVPKSTADFKEPNSTGSNDWAA